MLTQFKQRSSQPELMDNQETVYKDFHDCLVDLEIVNKLTLAYRPTAHWLRSLFKRHEFSRIYSILDVGSGGGDTLRFIARRSKAFLGCIELTGIDLNPWSQRYAEQRTRATDAIKFETGDIFDFSPTRHVDFIISSLFTHHLDDTQLVQFLRWMESHSNEGWFINDLHRHPIAYFSFKFLSRLFGFHYMVQHDGPISVTRAFTRKDWQKALTAAQIPLNQVNIEWFFPFRYCLTRQK